MKKLLSLIGAMTIISTSATSLTACSNAATRFDNPTIQDIIKKTIVAEIEQQINGQDKNLNYSFNQIFTQADLTSLAVKLLDSAIASYFYSKEENKRSSWVTKNPTPPTDKNSLNDFIETIAKNNLYTEYMSALAVNNALEIQVSQKGYNVSYQSPEWYVPGVVAPLVSKTGGMTVTDLNKNLKDLAADTATYTIVYTDTGAGAPANDVFLNASLADKKNMLATRFQDYYLHYEVSNVISNILTSAYIHNNEYLQHDSEININTGNSLFNNMQTSWLLNQGEPWYTNVKLVWELKLDKDQFTNNTTGVFKKLLDAYNTLPNPDPSVNQNNVLSYFNKALNPKNTDSTSGSGTGSAAYAAFNNVITEINNHSNNPSNTSNGINQINSGQDPVFEMDGFKGIVGINKGKVFTTNTLDSSYSNLITNNKVSSSFGFLMSSNSGDTSLNDSFLFNNSTNTPSVVLVLPVYTIDLMRNMKMSYPTNASSNYQDNASTDISLNTYNAAGVKTDLNDVWNQQQLPLTIPYEVAMLNNMPGVIGKLPTTANNLPDYTTNSIKSDLLSLIEYTFAQQTDIQNFAKQSFYSIAFNYNSNNVYSSQLYSQIGKYIINEN